MNNPYYAVAFLSALFFWVWPGLLYNQLDADWRIVVAIIPRCSRPFAPSVRYWHAMPIGTSQVGLGLEFGDPSRITF